MIEHHSAWFSLNEAGSWSSIQVKSCWNPPDWGDPSNRPFMLNSAWIRLNLWICGISLSAWFNLNGFLYQAEFRLNWKPYQPKSGWIAMVAGRLGTRDPIGISPLPIRSESGWFCATLGRELGPNQADWKSIRPDQVWLRTDSFLLQVWSRIDSLIFSLIGLPIRSPIRPDSGLL